MAAEKKRHSARQRAEWQEQQDEKIAPRAQSITVYARDGVTVLRGPRLERDGVTMIPSNPIKRLAARSRKKEFPTIGPVHQAAAERLLVDWEEGHGGISFGCANYGERTGGVTPKTGYISDAVIMHSPRRPRPGR